MLRLAVLLLLLANAGYFAWSQGLLAAWGVAPVQQSEPQRVDQQIKPEAVRVLAPDEAKRLEVGNAAKPAECLQAGLFSDSEAETLKKALDAWPPASWTMEPAVEPARWIVYMGKYPSPENLAKKKAELRQIGVPFEAATGAALEPGLALGGFATEAAAKAQLEALSQKGVRTARVLQEHAQGKGQLMKLPVVDDALRARLDEIKTALNGKALRACR